MAQIRRFAQQFEMLCENLLRNLGYDTKREFKAENGYQLDIVGLRGGNIELATEIKLVTENPATLSVLRNITSRARALFRGLSLSSDRLLLILSCNAEVEHVKWLNNEFEIQVWDRSRILSEAAEFGEFSNAFNKFFDELQQFENIGRDLSSADVGLPPELQEDVTIRGDELCGRLHSIPRGKKGASQFERLTVEIIDYLFGDYLLDARPHNRLEDDLSILDIIYRVRPGHPFWDTLTRDFRARVMVFECKNYSGPITPNQIYSTERYVSAGALRPICFLISRTKPHEHTELAAFGAMREGGKLFVFLDDEDMCEMLKMKDVQLKQDKEKEEESYFKNDPTLILDQKIYDFLGRLAR